MFPPTFDFQELTQRDLLKLLPTMMLVYIVLFLLESAKCSTKLTLWHMVVVGPAPIAGRILLFCRL